MSVAAAAFPNLPYHPTKSFVPLSMIANFPLIVVIPLDHPAKTVKELVEWAKKNPDKANYAATSPAFITATELLKLKSGMPGTMIPYKSSNEMILSVMQGQTLLAISDGPPAMPMIKAGKVKRDRGHRSEALGGTAGRAEHGGSRLPRGQHLALERLLRRRQHAGCRSSPSSRRRCARRSRSGRVRQAQGMAVTPGGTSSAEFRAMIDKDIEGYVAGDQGGEPEIQLTPIVIPDAAQAVFMPRFSGACLRPRMCHRFRRRSHCTSTPCGHNHKLRRSDAHAGRHRRRRTRGTDAVASPASRRHFQHHHRNTQPRILRGAHARRADRAMGRRHADRDRASARA